MSIQLTVENIRCGSCATSIDDALRKIANVTAVMVDPTTGYVGVDGTDVSREAVIGALARMGYPEAGATHGLDHALATAKS